MLIKQYFYGLYVVIGREESGVLLVYKRRNDEVNDKLSAYKHKPYSSEYDLVAKCSDIEGCEEEIAECIKQNIYRKYSIPGHEMDDILNGILVDYAENKKEG